MQPELGPTEQAIVQQHFGQAAQDFNMVWLVVSVGTVAILAILLLFLYLNRDWIRVRLKSWLSR